MLGRVDKQSGTPGLRERKKQATRQRIRQAAVTLFAAHGFERVTVAQVAEASDVSPATVFNYFPTKEDLILLGMAEYGAALVTTLRERPAGTTVLEAYRDHLAQPRGVLADPDPDAVRALVQVRRIIDESVALQAREQFLEARTAEALASLLADDEEVRVQHRFLAAAMVGVGAAMTREIHRLAVEGMPGPAIAEQVLPQGSEAVGVLIRGLAASTG